MAVELVHYKLTADEYQRMIEVGIIAEGAPVELIEGELIQMAAFGGEHLLRVGDLTRLLILATEPPLFVSPQGSIRLDTRSEPEADFAVLRSRPLGRTPPPARDVILVIEVSDTSSRATNATLSLRSSPSVIRSRHLPIRRSRSRSRTSSPDSR